MTQRDAIINRCPPVDWRGLFSLNHLDIVN